MDNFLHILFTWMHLLGVALFVGPQFFLAVAWVPASRGITDLPTRVKAMRTITTRFGYLGGFGLVLILIAGTYLISTWRTYYGIPDEESFTGLRYGVTFIVKMAVLLVMLALLALHTFVVGPRLLDKLEAQSRGENISEDDLRSFRMRSMALSITGLALTLGIMVMGVMLSTANWSLQAS